ncbi:hypothetical protein [Paraburkholderia sp. C35]|uniref:hypothetical protein n=1 Tax=Paraburkholderia sp. C35 TaxID=2126993 RepID=UPI000D69AE31|nr:hypothetical protein [Paraburkholderia sp. C35]
MILHCTTAELPTLLPALAGINLTLKIHVTDAPGGTSAPAMTPHEAVRMYDGKTVGAMFGYINVTTAGRLMKNARIPAVTIRTGARGGRRAYYDADRVDALRRQIDETVTAIDAAIMMGDTNRGALDLHTRRRDITPVLVAGRRRYRKEDVVALMKLRGLS